MASLHDNQWQAIRTAWEYDPDEPSYNAAAQRAGQKFAFAPPGKSSIDARAKREQWQRRGSLHGIVAAAQRKADHMTTSEGVGIANAGKAQASREESEDKRAEVTVRHRTEWRQVAVLRQEALAIRTTDPDGAMAKMRLAKTAAETTGIQQQGERKAWGLDVLMDVGSLKDMTDEQLEAIANGKVARH